MDNQSSRVVGSKETSGMRGIRVTEAKKNIGESVHLINDIIEYMDENYKEAILLSADFEKAFNWVEHSFIISTFRAFGFGPDFIQ